MKKIRIDKYTAPDPLSHKTIDKLYHVNLGNGFHGSFKSDKETKVFLAETNRELNVKMYELNFLFAELLKIYRHAWPYFEQGQKHVKNNLQYLIKNKINAIEGSFDYLVDRAAWANGNHTAFTHLYSIIGTIKEICLELSELYLSKNQSVSMYECDCLVVRLEYVYTAIVIYPQKIELVKENRQIKAVLKVV